MELADVVKQASRRGSLASEEGFHLRPEEYPINRYRSRSPSPVRGFQSPTPPHRWFTGLPCVYTLKPAWRSEHLWISIKRTFVAMLLDPCCLPRQADTLADPRPPQPLAQEIQPTPSWTWLQRLCQRCCWLREVRRKQPQTRQTRWVVQLSSGCLRNMNRCTVSFKAHHCWVWEGQIADSLASQIFFSLRWYHENLSPTDLCFKL